VITENPLWHMVVAAMAVASGGRLARRGLMPAGLEAYRAA
jgi:hypothetical protein